MTRCPLCGRIVREGAMHQRPGEDVTCAAEVTVFVSDKAAAAREDMEPMKAWFGADDDDEYAITPAERAAAATLAAHPEALAAAHIEFLQDMGEKVLRVARTHFDIAPVPPAATGCPSCGIDFPEAVATGTLKHRDGCPRSHLPLRDAPPIGPTPAPLDPDRTDGALPPLAPVVVDPEIDPVLVAVLAPE